MDNLLIFTPSKEEHAHVLHQVLQHFQDYDLYLHPVKCSFYQTSTEYLGFIVSHNQVKMDPIKIAAITDWKTPTTLKHVQSFLGFANFYCHFIPKFSNIARPLNQLAKKDTPFEWGVDQQKAFEKLKNIFTTHPFLLIPDISKPFQLKTDASRVAVGAVLSQQTVV